ncbi:MAG: glycosyltransferase [Cyclobacteriaceae bacterium]|nr:glycosyltransferase [Cyclobacteriaceae bacterium]
MQKIKLLFLIDSLNAGGAQQQLFELVKGLDKLRYDITIISWYPGNFYEELCVITGVEWWEVKRKSRYDFSPLIKAFKIIRSQKINIIHAYLDSACFYGAVCKLFFRRIIFIATERSSFKNLTRLQKIHKPVSHFLADMTIANSYAGAKYLAQLGVNERKIKIIRNGIDTGRLNPSHDQMEDFRKNASFPHNKRIILMVGRITRLKNQLLVLDAYTNSSAKDNFILLFVGNSDTEYGVIINNFIGKNDLSKNVYILNASNSISLYYSVSEVVLLFSDFEGSPNVVLEAMATSRPVISSDVGDVKYFVDDSFGWILPVRDHNALIETFNLIACMSTKELMDRGALAYQKFERLQLSTSTMVSHHVNLYSELTSALV